MPNIVTQINKGYLNNCNLMQLLKILNYLSTETFKQVNVKFVPSISLKFPEHEIEKILIKSETKNNIEVEITTNFLGIIGTSSALPSHYTEHIIECKKEKDYSLLNFIGVFHHKIIQLFINIIKEYNVGLQYEEYLKIGNQDYNWHLINNLIGLTKSFTNNLIKDILLNYAGLLINTSRSASVLQTILTEYLQYPVVIEQFVLQTIKLIQSELSILGQVNHQLGTSLYLGKYAYFTQNKIIIKIYDLDFKSYNRFAQDEILKATLIQILDFYLDIHIEKQIVFLILEQEKFTKLCSKNAKRLGINMWCKG